ncbi:hypothetical protein FSB73_07975 [Arachidicoccus ginsenosidivorans]|uniref:Uncharacterized protein n=1 Tax=Arachidicoccus ginsenosidivorans TaxID=496057 RepID=A0A5B8VKA0_9BACT|nr:hypothetical protein [Arachidicoccus ginsenosidivorans]QEC71613.1 hypothetical protein FSB73_07975 [Arachidicoccus ginsenosidivorans]
MKLEKGNFFKLWLPTRESAGRLVFENPTDNTLRQDADKSIITAFVYDEHNIEKLDLSDIGQCKNLIGTQKRSGSILMDCVGRKLVRFVKNSVSTN